MAYLFGLVVVALFFMALHYFTELGGKEKAMVTAVVFLIIGGAVAYNAYTDAQRTKIGEIERRFNQGKILECNGISVSNATFTYSVGTQTFIGNEGSEHYQTMISALECR